MAGGYRRRRRFKRRGYNRGGGVTVGNLPSSGVPINIMDGGHDAPLGPDSPRTRTICWLVLAAVGLAWLVFFVTKVA